MFSSMIEYALVMQTLPLKVGLIDRERLRPVSVENRAAVARAAILNTP